MKKIILFLILAASLGFLLFISYKTPERYTPDLDGFLKLIREDPLFYSSFFATANFEKAIGTLEGTEDQFRETILANLETKEGPEKDRYLSILEENRLFPYQFLENLILIDRETKAFWENPSVERGESLLLLYDAAADSYIEEISSKIEVLEKIEEYKTVEPYFFFVDSISSLGIIKNDFLIIKENGYKLKAEVEKRRSCLTGKEICPLPPGTKNSEEFINLLKESNNFEQEEERTDFIKELLPYRSFEMKGPYKINSSCWQSQGSEHWLYLLYMERDNELLVIPKLVNQNYYAKGFEGELDGIDSPVFYALSEASVYECTDLTFYPQLLTLDFLKEKIGEGAASEEDLRENPDYKLLAENQFGLMAPAINTISAHLNIFRLRLLATEDPSAPEFLFSIRTAYSMLYFPFAESIWRLDKDLQYFVPENEKPVGGNSKFITLDELEESGYTKEEIKEFHKKNWEFIDSLLKD
jgi:hypothetical protein